MKVEMEKGNCECNNASCLCGGTCRREFTFRHPGVLVDTQQSDYPEILCVTCAECLINDLKKENNQ